MTPLRAKYIRDLTVRGRAQRTQRAYTRYVSELAHYYQRSPELISYEEVTNWLYHLIKERQLSASSVNVAVNAVRFLYGITLGRNTEALTASVPHMKHPIRRAEVYARSELEAILSAPSQPRDRAFLMTVYAHFLFSSLCKWLVKSRLNSFQISEIWLQAYFEIIEDRLLVRFGCDDFLELHVAQHDLVAPDRR